VRQLTINVDMDGVMYDFNEAITHLAQSVLKRELPVTTGWSMWDAWGISQDEWYKIFNMGIQHFNLFNQPHYDIHGGVEALKQFRDEGHRVRIVTAKKLRLARSTTMAQAQVLDWLQARDLRKGIELVFASGADKRNFTADVIVDDKPTLTWAQEGKMNLLFDQPWNQMITAEDPVPSHGRAQSWNAVTAEVYKEARR